MRELQGAGGDRAACSPATRGGPQVAADRHLQRRVLRIEQQDDGGSDGSSSGVSDALTLNNAHSHHAPKVKPPADPLNAAELEQYMLSSTNLLQLRPPIEPALSGDNFTRVIPFQILSWYPRCARCDADLGSRGCCGAAHHVGQLTMRRRASPHGLSPWPRLVVFPAFVDPERCRLIVEYARDKLSKSGLAYRPGEKEDQDGQQTRTSSGQQAGVGRCFRWLGSTGRHLTRCMLSLTRSLLHAP